MGIGDCLPFQTPFQKDNAIYKSVDPKFSAWASHKEGRSLLESSFFENFWKLCYSILGE